MKPLGSKIDVLLVEKPGQISWLQPLLASIPGADVHLRLHVLEDTAAAARASELFNFDLVALDATGKGTASFEDLALLTSSFLHSPVLVFSDLPGEEWKIRALRDGAAEALSREETTPELIVFMLESVKRRNHVRKLEAPNKEPEANSDLFRKIILHNVDGILILDENGEVRFTNPAAEKMFDRFSGGLIGTVLGFPLVTDRPTEIEILRKDGELLQADMRVVAISWEGRKAYLASLRNMTERKRIETELVRAKDEAFKASKMKTDFLANVSHEIRTPMNAMLGMAELLGETQLDEEQARYVQILARSGRTLLALINDILDLSKIEAGQLELERTPFKLASLIDSTLDLMHARATEKGLYLKFSMEDDVPRSFVGDPHRLRQIILNLMGNGIKFTQKGGIEIHVRNDKDAPGSLVFAVHDSGVGIPQEKFADIFSRFTQVDSSVTRRHGGSGLGLTIVRQLVELMNGRVWLESELGKGTTFYFSLPLKEFHDSLDMPAAKLFEDLKVIVVDPSAEERGQIRRLLEFWGCKITECDEWRFAIDAIQNETSPTEAVTIISRESMVTVDTADKQTADPNQSTVHKEYWTVLMAEPEAWQESGSPELRPAAYVSKPLTPFKLLQGLARATGRQLPNDLSAPDLQNDKRQGDQRTLDILLVEDSMDNQALIRGYLRTVPHRLTIADNGYEGVQKYKGGQYDIVLMDVQMPIMDGLTATQTIREYESENGLKHTPIVALTASALAQDVERSLQVGCDVHVSKPVSKSVLLQAIYDELNIQPQEASPTRDSEALPRTNTGLH